jgi:hypothetical protein
MKEGYVYSFAFGREGGGGVNFLSLYNICVYVGKDFPLLFDSKNWLF